METKVNIPVSNHGLHTHRFSCPTLTTHRFFDVFPIYSQRFFKGEKTDFNLDIFGRTNPFVQAAMMTGRYTIRKYFVPYRLVMRGWYDFDQRVNHQFSNGEFAAIQYERYVQQDEISAVVADDPELMTESNLNDCDIAYNITDDPTALVGRKFTSLGKKVFRILRSLGVCPTFTASDHDKISILDVLCWLKLYIDWIYPAQYANDNDYMDARSLLEADTADDIHVNSRIVISVLKRCVCTFYDQSIFDFAWDNPVSPNNFQYPSITLYDITQSPSASLVTSDNEINAGTPTAYFEPDEDNGITQYLLDGLQSINNYIKRHQLAGNRVAERFYSERGQKLADAVLGRSLYLGENSISLRVGDVENNMQGEGSTYGDNLGELAGKGTISSDNMSLPVKEEFSEDGLLIVSLCAVPDCPPILYNHPRIYEVESLDHYHGAFDKLGVEAIKQACVLTSHNGGVNNMSLSGVFGFLNRYYSELFKPARLLGDFVVESTRKSLSQYHGFRMLRDYQAYGGNIRHSKEFISTQFDGDQFQRFFYSNETDNLITLIWFTGKDVKFKLPIGDSYDWDDDEDNQKVQIELKSHE